MEWGTIPPEHLSMSALPSDSNANAVVLFDVGDASFDENYELIFTRHTRIKILNAAGYGMGTSSFTYHSGGRDERYKGLEGVTYTMDPSGEVREQEMDDESVFEEELNEKWTRVKFTLPSLSPGCVIEYRYTIQADKPYYLDGWSFQTTEPVHWSEYRVKTPSVFQYAIVTQGYQPYLVSTVEQVRESFLTSSGGRMMDMLSYRWVVKDAPAIREEPYITTIEDYRNRLSIQLMVVAWPGESPRRILESWDKVARELNGLESFGGQIHPGSAIRNATELVTAGITDPLRKVQAIYRFVSTAIVWDGLLNYIADHDVESVLESKTGNSGDINLLLTAMLRAADIPAAPVLLSTRSNGKITQMYPLVDQFNHVICEANVGSKPHLLDATERLRPWTLLPQRALNHTGLKLDNDTYSWIPIEATGKFTSNISLDMTLGADGSLGGTAQQKFAEYSAFAQRRDLAERKPDEYVKSLLRTETTGFTVDSSTILDRDSLEMPLTVNAVLRSPTYGQVLDDFIYLNPMTIARSTENPFKLESRTYPVDFAIPLQSIYSLRLALPPGYVLKEMPRNAELSLPSAGGKYSRNSSLDGQGYRINVRFEINQTLFKPNDYRALRSFFQQVVMLESEQLVLQKQPPPSPEPAQGKRN
jgi:hypothetical protein